MLTLLLTHAAQLHMIVAYNSPFQNIQKLNCYLLPLACNSRSLKLAKDIGIIKDNGLTEMKTQVDLGSNFYMQAKM